MKNEHSLSYSKSIFASIESFLYLCNSSILDVQTSETNLSVSSFSQLQTARLCNLHVSRLIHMFNFLVSSPDPHEKTNFSNIELETLLENLCTHFQDTVLERSSICLQHHTALKNSGTLMIDRAKFELLILNVLHCSIKGINSDSRKVPQITIYITETKNDIVFHIRDNGNPLGDSFVHSAFNIMPSTVSDVFTALDVVLLNLAVAHKSALEMNGSIKYTSLKSGNRFDIHLPKAPPEMPLRFGSPRSYSPDSELFLGIMADIILENLSTCENEVRK